MEEFAITLAVVFGMLGWLFWHLFQSDLVGSGILVGMLLEGFSCGNSDAAEGVVYERIENSCSITPERRLSYEDFGSDTSSDCYKCLVAPDVSQKFDACCTGELSLLLESMSIQGEAEQNVDFQNGIGVVSQEMNIKLIEAAKADFDLCGV